MKVTFKLLVAIFSITLVSCNAQEIKKEDLKTQEEKASYSIGFDIGQNMKQNYVEIDPDKFLAGLLHGLADSAVSLLTEDEMMEVMTQFQTDLTKKREEKTKTDSDKNQKEGNDFLAENKTKDGVVVLPSGLQYKVINSGTGKKPTESSNVTVHYTGTLINGDVFDSSIKRGEPTTFPVTGVIKGWTEALLLMKEGDKWMLYIPSELAYGANGAGGVIGPNQTLIFEVELISVQ